MNNDRHLRYWNVGDPITSRRLNRMVRSINEDVRSAGKPREIIPNGEDLADNPVDDSETIETVYTETARSESTITVTDSAGNTHSINQIDSVTFEDGSGNVMVLQFNNP